MNTTENQEKCPQCGSAKVSSREAGMTRYRCDSVYLAGGLLGARTVPCMEIEGLRAVDLKARRIQAGHIMSRHALELGARDAKIVMLTTLRGIDSDSLKALEAALADLNWQIDALITDRPFAHTRNELEAAIRGHKCTGSDCDGCSLMDDLIALLEAPSLPEGPVMAGLNYWERLYQATAANLAKAEAKIAGLELALEEANVEADHWAEVGG